ncbi:MAG: T9SS type A sorting domain-containing protein [Balneolales bacterium]|nr:T9SS type A sorting domain-containing protein [Balneolales bacterium]
MKNYAIILLTTCVLILGGLSTSFASDKIPVSDEFRPEIRFKFPQQHKALQAIQRYSMYTSLFTNAGLHEAGSFPVEITTDFNDGDVFIPSEKVAYTWNGEQMLSQTNLFATFDDETEWANESRLVFEYESGRILSAFFQVYMNGWTDVMKEEFEFETVDGRAVLSTVSVYEKNGGWELVGFTELNYEMPGSLVIDIFEVSGGSGELIPELQIIVDAAEDGVSQIINDFWDGNNWLDKNQLFYHDISFWEAYEFILYLSPFVDYGSNMLMMEAMNFPEKMTSSFWDGSEWVEESRMETSFNSENGVIESKVWLYSYFDPFSESWEPEFREILFFNNNGTYDSGSGDLYFGDDEWFPFFKEKFSYNEENLLSMVELILSFTGEDVPVQRSRIGYENNPVSVVPDNELAKAITLDQNYPNPFNPATTIAFTLPASESVRLAVYNIAGQRVALLVNETLQAGTHSVRFDASNLASGLYLYQLETQNTSLTRKMMLVK